MRPAEQGFLLLASCLGNPERHPLSASQIRTLFYRMKAMPEPAEDRELAVDDLIAIGYREDMAQRIIRLLSQTRLLEGYLGYASQEDCRPLTRISEGFPAALTEKLGAEAPACIWLKGNASLLERPAVSLVGSRELLEENACFAREVGKQAALQGYVLISGNARGADRIAQDACLEYGGNVICVVADTLLDKMPNERMLYISEDAFDLPFSAQRAHSRNRLIHCLSAKTFVAQAQLRKGGTWTGTERNLRSSWSDIFCFADGSETAEELIQMGAIGISVSDLRNIARLRGNTLHFF